MLIASTFSIQFHYCWQHGTEPKDTGKHLQQQKHINQGYQAARQLIYWVNLFRNAALIIQRVRTPDMGILNRNLMQVPRTCRLFYKPRMPCPDKSGIKSISRERDEWYFLFNSVEIT